MSRTERLFALVQLLRRHHRPVSGRSIAAELGVSLRTVYRDIASLQAQGAGIEGEAGVGYVLAPGFLLPPLMFSQDELEALVLGSRWVARSADAQLGRAAGDALAKIAAVLPGRPQEDLEASPLLVGPRPAIEDGDLGALRSAIRAERKLRLAYTDETGARTRRTVWPFALGVFDRTRVLVAWCELRDAIRHFETTRICELRCLDDRYPRRRIALLKEWRTTHPASAPP